MTKEATEAVEMKAAIPRSPRPVVSNFTGRTRFRTNQRGKLILQVEFKQTEWIGEVIHVRKWRDANVQDLLSGIVGEP